MKVAFIGLGIMGRPMAHNLVRGGHALRVFSRRAESMAPLSARGAVACASPQEAARGAEVVISMVPDAADVEAIIFGPRGIVGSAAPGTIHIDMSTIAPAAARELAGRAKIHDIDMLDAPVSGGEAGAIDARLTIMVGGEVSAFERVQALLGCMGQTVTHVGRSGAGQVAKACNQIVTGMAIASIAEAFNFARARGVDPGAVRRVLMGGFAASRILENHGARMIARNFEPGFKSWMHLKDLCIVMDEAHRLKLALPGAAAATQLFSALVGSGLGQADSVAVVKVLERMSGAEETK